MQVHVAELNKDLADTTDTALTAEAEVSNTRSRAGDEIVQLYVALTGTSTIQPVRARKGFQHIVLAPGESKRVQFDVKENTFAICNAGNEFAVETTKVSVGIAHDSAHGSGAPTEFLP